MNRSKLMRRLIGGISVIATAAILTFSGCTQIDTSLGSDLTLSTQGMKLGQLNISTSIDGGKYFESRLYMTDSISSASLSYGYMGSMVSDTFGMRTAGFYTQYISGYTLDDDVFGYLPIFDSAMLYLSVEAYGGDTNVVQKYEVFEILDDDFVTESADSVFFPNFDIEPYIDLAKPIFTFSFPDQDNEIYTSSTALKMANTDYTAEFIQRLMLEKTTGDYDESIYEDDEEWVEYFKGLYIRPVVDSSSEAGAIYTTLLESSGFGFYGRSREEYDYTLIKDTIGMTYVFYSSYAEAGNVSINMIDYDYDNSLIDLNDVKTPYTTDTESIPTTSVLRVSGMAGVVSEITFTQELFERLDTILAAEEAETGEVYNSLFFNQAKMKIYMTQLDSYDLDMIDPFLVTPWMNSMPSNLGLYTNYSSYYVEDEDNEDTVYTTLTGVADYVYAYESSYTLDFGGGLNRSWCCYVLNIPGALQSAWNYYLDAKAEAEENGTEIDWDAVEDRVVYLAPTATSLFTTQYASLQAGEADNSAPIYLELTYTMIR